MPPRTPNLSSSTNLTLFTLVSLLLLECVNQDPASEPLHWLFPLPRKLVIPKSDADLLSYFRFPLNCLLRLTLTPANSRSLHGRLQPTPASGERRPQLRRLQAQDAVGALPPSRRLLSARRDRAALPPGPAQRAQDPPAAPSARHDHLRPRASAPAQRALVSALMPL